MVYNIPPITKKPIEIINNGNIADFTFETFAYLSGSNVRTITPTKKENYTQFKILDSSTTGFTAWIFSKKTIDLTTAKKLLVSIPSYEDLKQSGYQQFAQLPAYIEIGFYPYSAETAKENSYLNRSFFDTYIPPNAIRYRLKSGSYGALSEKEKQTMIEYSGYTGLTNAILNIKNLKGNYYLYFACDSFDSSFENAAFMGDIVRITNFSIT